MEQASLQPLSPGAAAASSFARAASAQSHEEGLAPGIGGNTADAAPAAAGPPNQNATSPGKLRSPRSGAQTARAGESRKEFEARKKLGEARAKHAKLIEQRHADDRQIKDRCVRNALQRERRFEVFMDTITGNDHLRVQTARGLREHEAELRSKLSNLHEKRDQEVFQRIEVQLQKFMTRQTDVPPAEGWREELRKGDCPVNKELLTAQKEEEFHRTARAILGVPGLSQPGQLRETIVQRERFLAEAASRAPCRPTLPVDVWGQQELNAQPYGFFSRAFEAVDAGGPVRTVRRMGTDVHQLDESDGVPAAGKTRTRFERNRLGMLTGDVAKNGESARHRKPYGAGSGAPCQDHYLYERGNEVVDAEFPVGKRTYPFLIR